jgi:WD repeat-containing protein 23
VIRVYDTRKGFKLMKQIHARNVGWSVLDVALSPDGRHLIYTSWCDYSK